MNYKIHTIQKQLAVAAAGVAMLVSAIMSGCSVDECELSEARCDGNVAIGCYEYNGKGIAGNQRSSITCTLPMMCVAGDGYAVCALKPEPCDPMTFVDRCEGELPVICTGAEGDAEGKTFEVLSVPCQYGNTCVAGGCGVPGDMTCDPKTYAPSCDQGKPTVCWPVGEYMSDRYRVAYAGDACKDENPCFSGTGYAGCGRDGTQCTGSTFVDRCEGDSLIRCFDATMQNPMPPFLGLEYVTTCANGCEVQNGLAGCRL